MAIDAIGPRIPLYTKEFAADPHRMYRAMRQDYGTLVPIELAPGIRASLVIGYHTAVRILNDPENFPADPRLWQRTVPADNPVMPMLEWRPNALRSSGADHVRYRQATVAAIAEIDLHGLHSVVARTATPLIDGFSANGGADLISQYAFPLVFQIINVLLGCPADIGQRIAQGTAIIWAAGENAEQGNKMLTDAMLELALLRRANPADDIVSRLIKHPARLSDEEMTHQIATLYGAGIEPTTNLIANTMLKMLTDDRFAGNLLGGNLTTRDALDELLYTDPPGANYCLSYPRHPILVDGVWLPAHQPVMISMAACNNDPEIRGSGGFLDNRAHLAWSAGPHACPAKSPAYLIAQDAIDQLTDVLPELSLAVPADELDWRPGPFNRALAALPVRFPPSRPAAMP
ncbi:cytochrome P450 [Nocardia stercoris]|uniref:Cytochrome P450 n=1 Tax=Nocardia stercoris TaxID=2483361 RepID=A0A3M2LG81_9NOCA|nr:cytochrome P450 [Nocardia stercoris]